ncbi:hypothetical protein LY90DRAFT_218221 [Neocallimastix californiae]|uniref:Right handed beta helix domain-containing protein n=1 Tax=Neocallimastix californiae TaxID=1754190 RepID=A0A1Y1YYI7_9FUNG|nr:hypothetical protein LY90DRAFT_218221 [Neocallimastix californiae]|eukprot:ORY02767.1 hypothetical protein LY90DRAFT_218221 [Neocallimastix californiae]
MISMVDTIGKIENSFIHNGFSSGHEAISISVNSELVIQNSKINNIYSSGTISLISNDGILNIENTEIYNNLNITRYYNWKFNNAGSVITNSNNGRLETKNINIHDIITSTVFFIKNFSKTKATNVTMSNIEIYNYGAPFTTYDTTDAILDVENVYIKNIKQYGDKHGGLLIWLESYTEVTIKNCIIENGFSAHEKSRIVYFLAPDKCKLSLINSEFRNINLAHFLIVFDKGNYLGLDNLRFINCKSYSGIFLISNTSGEMEINNIYIDGFNKNMANMDFTTEILNVDYLDLIYGYLNISTIFFYGKNSALKINNLTIVNSSLYTGFVTTTDIDIKITNSKIDNNLIFNSFIYLDDYIRSKYNIFNTTFNSNIGMTGVIMQNRKSYYYDSELHYFEQCIFKNNRAIKNGGIIFSLVDVSDSIFKDCKFINNNAEAGSVSFTKKKIYEPKFIPDIYSDPDNILNNGLLYGGPFVTNPNRVLCNPIEPKFINSGDNINVNCSLLDEYDNKYNLLKDPETASILDVVFLKLQ